MTNVPVMGNFNLFNSAPSKGKEAFHVIVETDTHGHEMRGDTARDIRAAQCRYILIGDSL